MSPKSRLKIYEEMYEEGIISADKYASLLDEERKSKLLIELAKNERAKIMKEIPRCKVCKKILGPEYIGKIFDSPVLPLCPKHYRYYKQVASTVEEITEMVEQERDDYLENLKLRRDMYGF